MAEFDAEYDFGPAPTQEMYVHIENDSSGTLELVPPEGGLHYWSNKPNDVEKSVNCADSNIHCVPNEYPNPSAQDFYYLTIIVKRNNVGGNHNPLKAINTGVFKSGPDMRYAFILIAELVDGKKKVRKKIRVSPPVHSGGGGPITIQI